MFSVKDADRSPAIAVDVHKEEKYQGIFIVPEVGQVKEYCRKNNLNYSVPRFVGLNHYYICSKYKGPHNTERFVTAVNPLILSTEGLVFVEETQHGVEGIYLVPRHPRILVAYFDGGLAKSVQRELLGLSSLQFQQAVQAANGLFISDFGLRVDDNEEYTKASDEDKNLIAQEYFKALRENFNEEIEKDSETKTYLSATEFLAEKVELDNASQGILPADISKELDRLEEEQIK